MSKFNIKKMDIYFIARILQLLHTTNLKQSSISMILIENSLTGTENCTSLPTGQNVVWADRLLGPMSL
jgi:hypothetical protein